jgi:glycosyltransferase involved in cell wall biosynthesis
VVAPRVPNLEEILTDGENALLFDTNQPGSLENALTQLCEDAALREQLGRNARESIQTRGFTWLNNAKRITHQFQTLLTDHAK